MSNNNIMKTETKNRPVRDVWDSQDSDIRAINEFTIRKNRKIKRGMKKFSDKMAKD